MAQRRRQDLIMELIQQNGFVTTEQLVDQFKVTPQTIRRDLNDLASQKKLRRHHGGAGIDSSTVNTAYQARKIMDLEAKERIAEALVDMIPDNSSMFINIGTTTETKGSLGNCPSCTCGDSRMGKFKPTLVSKSDLGPG